jgi:Streptomyces sporulation and cell division protein, SsgA
MSNDRENRPIATELAARLLQQGSKSVAARIHLQYGSTDPYAIEMTIRLRDQTPISWLLGRDLLDDGLRQESGVGDVRITPCPQAPTTLLHITLRDDIGAVDLEMRFAPVAEFLRLTYLQVPQGTEGLFVLIEDDVSALVG